MFVCFLNLFFWVGEGRGVVMSNIEDFATQDGRLASQTTHNTDPYDTHMDQNLTYKL